ncbi:hypothetical protein GCM10027088_36240 [Nocardia goodfellowii]
MLADAVDVARRALLELEPSAVGTHLGVSAEDESAATHRFEATLPGYRGWQWAVVVAAPPGADRVTVSESALLPGPEALVAPEFVPWEQRVRPGDLAPGDLLAPPADDPRLVPGYVATGDPVVDEVAYEVGLGRSKVLSLEGRAEAADRWYAEFGPDTDMAKAAPSTCGLCGFYLPLAGALRAAFGVCANAMGADGRVVHAEYGCGAHSDVEAPTGGGSPLYEAFDDAAFDVIPAEALRKPEQAPDSSADAEEQTAHAATGSESGEPDAEASASESAAPAETVAETSATTTTEPESGVPAGVAESAAAEAAAASRVEAVAAAGAEGGGSNSVAEPGVEAVASVGLAAEGVAGSGAEIAAASADEAGVESAAAGEAGNGVVGEGASENGAARANVGEAVGDTGDTAVSSAVVSVRPKAEVAVRAHVPGSEPVDAHIVPDESVTYVADSKGEVVAGGEPDESAAEGSVTYVADSQGEVAVAEQVEMLGDAGVEDSESESSRN